MRECYVLEYFRYLFRYLHLRYFAVTERFLGIVGVSKSKRFLRPARNKSSFRNKS